MKLFIIIIAASFFCNCYSQPETTVIARDSVRTFTVTKIKMTVRSAPKFTLELNVMYNYGVYELSGNYNGDFNSQEFIEGRNFGVRHGFGGALTGKLPLHKAGHLRANLSLSYNNFSSKYNKSLSGTEEFDYMNYHVFSGILGIENNFTPNFRIKTYVGIGLVGSVIYGNGRITDNVVTTDIDVMPAFRLGLSVNSGLEYMLSNTVGLNCGIRFTHANIWLKSSKLSNQYNEVYLNDEKTDENIPYSGFKQFAWGSFFIGANYFFGIEEKNYVFTRK